jgi:polyisoprenoid-binding protein YceI
MFGWGCSRESFPLYPAGFLIGCLCNAHGTGMMTQTKENQMMKWSTMKQIGIALAAAVVVTGCSNPADNVTPAEVKDAEKPSGSTEASDTAKTYTFNGEGSKVEFTGSKVTGKHDGGFKSFEGTLAVEDGKLASNGSKVDIDMTSTWSDAEKLTGHLKSPDFFDVEKFPASTFEFIKVEHNEGTTQVTGNLTFHGVTKSVSFPATVSVEGDKAFFKAEFFIKRFDFGIKYPGKADDLIRDEVVIRLDVQATAG